MLPKKSALTSYSYRLSHAHQQRFLAALDRQMIGAGLATSGEAVFDLDFHAVCTGAATRPWKKHYVPTRSQRARSVLTFFAHNLNPAIMRRWFLRALSPGALALRLFA